MDFSNLSGKNLSEAFGVATKTITRWKKEGMPMNRDGQTFNLPDVITWAIDRAKCSVTAEKEPDEATKWMTEFRKERALMARIERERVEGSVIDRSTVAGLLTERAVEFRRALLGLSRRLALRLVGKTSGEIQGIVTAEAKEILKGYSRPDSLTKGAKDAKKKK